MSAGLKEKIAAVNARVTALLDDSRRALRGERCFGPEQVRSLSQPISEMAPIMARAQEFTAQQPEIETEISFYRQQLRELLTTLEHLRMMLLSKRSRVEETRHHLQAVSQWAAATRLIR